MSTLPLLAQLFVSAVVVSGGVLLARALQFAVFDRVPLLIGLVVAAMITARVKLRLPTTKNRSTMSVSNAVTFTSLLLLGPHPTMVVALASAWCQSTFGTRDPNPLHRTLFNIASLLLTVQASGYAYATAGGVVGNVAWPDMATPLGAATLTYFLVNCGTVAVVVSLSTRQSVGYVFYRDFACGAPSYFVAAGAAALAAVAIDQSAYAFLPLAATPMYVTYRAYQAYAGRLVEERRHRDIVESLNEGMFALAHDGRVELWNDAIERITGISRSLVLHRELFDAVPALRKAEVAPAIGSTRQGSPAVLPRLEFNVGSSKRILHVRLFPFDGGVTGFVTDITDRTAAEEALKLSEERYALALEGAKDGIWDWDLIKDAIFLSPRGRSMLGLPAGSKTSSPADVFAAAHRDDLPAFKAALSAHLANPSDHFEHEFRIGQWPGEYRWILARGVAIMDGRGRPVRMAGSLTDVTQHHRAEAQLRHAATHDTLTGLPNRAHFTEMLETALARSKRRSDYLFGALFIDVDRFKSVNDTLGHHVGDQLLVDISKRLQASLRRGDVTARLGGDEFTILLSELRDVGEAVQVASRIRESFGVPFVLAEQELFVTVSIGMALSSAGYTRAEDVLRDADVAMYQAKALGGNRHEIFDVHLHAAEIERMKLENEIRSGLERGTFFLEYQPIVSLSSDQMVAFEASPRWRRRDGRTTSPEEFIDVLGGSDTLAAIGRWSVREVCRQLSVWNQRHPASRVHTAVRVSARQLLHGEFADQIEGALHDEGVSPEQLLLQIPEEAIAQDGGAVAAALQRVQALGVRVCVDDFGAGRSSLRQLHLFRVSAIKIAAACIRHLGADRESAAIVESTLALARSIDADVIAQEVTTPQQARWLKQMGCDYAQGLLFGEALPVARAERLLMETTMRSAAIAGAAAVEHSLSIH